MDCRRSYCPLSAAPVLFSDAYVVSREDPDDIRVCTLGQTMWATAETGRLDCFVGPLLPRGLTEAEYLRKFS